MWKTWTASPKSITTASSGERSPWLGRGDHEVQQHRLTAGRGDQHVAARAEPGQQRLGHERRHQRGQRRVDGVAAGAQDVGAGGGGQGVTGRDDAAFSHPQPPTLRSA